jgi:TonB family protein
MNYEVLTISFKRIKSAAGKKLILLVLTITSSLFTVQAQMVPLHDDNQPLVKVQQMPKFKGDMNKYLADSIKYPETEKKAKISGTVYVTFVIERDGSISNVKLLRGVPNGPGLDAEAIRVISAMPKWSPGMQDGHAVRVQFNLPIRFALS